MLAVLCDSPPNWADHVRYTLVDEYALAHDKGTVYHPAHKLLLITMVARGLHDVNVLKFAPPKHYPARPEYRLAPKAGGADDKADDAAGAQARTALPLEEAASSGVPDDTPAAS